LNATRKDLLRDKERSKAALVQAATDLFAPQGPESISTDAVAGRAGVNKRLIYYYFRDKSGLYNAVIEAAYKQLESALPIMGASQDLRALLVESLTFLGAHPAIAKLLVYDLQRQDGRSRVNGRALHRELEKLSSVASQGRSDRGDVLVLLESVCQLSILGVLRPRGAVPRHMLHGQVLLGAEFLLAVTTTPASTAVL